jgi:hypothetical protein
MNVENKTKNKLTVALEASRVDLIPITKIGSKLRPRLNPGTVI